jgi:hypothetical protein
MQSHTKTYQFPQSVATVPKKSELQDQAEFFQWAWNTYPDTRRCLFHVPNGGKRSKVEAAWMKSSGVISGIPDLLFVWKGKLHAMEGKTEKGRVSDAQDAVHKAWAAQGITVHIYRSAEEAKSIFINILNQSK